mgnify:CR=1 FL=1
MKNRKNKFLALGLGVVLGLSCVFSSYATSADLKDAKKKVSSLQEEKKKVQDTLKQLEGLKSDAAAYVKELDKKLTSLDSELSQLEKDISAKEDQIENTKAELEEAKAVEKEQYASMKLRIQYMYENGNVSFADSIMTSKNASQLLNRAEYASQIATYDRKMLKEYQATREKINQKEQDLETEHSNLLALQESTEAKQASVKELMSSKQKELTSYNSQIGAAQSSIDQYNADIKAQEEHMARVEAEIRRKEEEARKAEEARRAEEAKKNQSSAGGDSTVKKGNTNFIWPCPASGRISSAFGDRSSPTEGASTNHKGIDIPAPSGSSIVAAADGKVVISTYSYSAGNYIMIDHGGGLTTVYMHCSQLLVKEGETVKQGQTIAKVGSTGYSTGPHLHFGVRSGGSYVNPSGYVSP